MSVNRGDRICSPPSGSLPRLERLFCYSKLVLARSQAPYGAWSKGEDSNLRRAKPDSFTDCCD